jgi:copper resistance protein D
MPIDRFLRLFDYLSVILRGGTLAFQSLAIGGIAFLILVLRAASPEALAIESTCRRWIRWSAVALALNLVAYLVLNLFTLTATTGLSLLEVIGANHVFAAGLSIAAALAIVYLTGVAGRRPVLIMMVPAALIIGSAVMTSHSVARLDNRVLLAVLTGLHQAATAVWIGGLPFLLLVLYKAQTPAFLRETAKRFSAVALTSVVVLTAAGVGMGVAYVGSWSGLYGTAYGTMVAGKGVLLAFLLVLGGMNFLTVHAQDGIGTAGASRVRCFCEAEIGIGLTVLIAAASLTSQPPATDLTERLTRAEIVSRMTPQRPSFTTPSVTEFPAKFRIADPDKATPEQLAARKQALRLRDQQDTQWSEYNHHWAGLVVLTAGLLAFLAGTDRFKWARNWPLAFIGLGVFLFFRDDPESWPLGPRGFWQSWLNPEDLQHRFFVLLIVAFAVYEWKVQTGRVSRQVPALVFPAVCLLAGAALLAHSHSFGNVKEELFAELSHLPIAILGVLAGWSRWLEMRLPPRDPAKSALAWVWPVCLVLVGAILLNYREA